MPEWTLFHLLCQVHLRMGEKKSLSESLNPMENSNLFEGTILNPCNWYMERLDEWRRW